MISVLQTTPMAFLILKPQEQHQGVSLVEMLISLMLFTAIVFPLMMLPIKALDQSEEGRNESIIDFEANQFFGELNNSIGLAYRFFPLDEDTVPNGECMEAFNPHKQLFLAYWDETSKSVVRVGYGLKKIEGSVSKWQFVKTTIPANPTLKYDVANKQGALRNYCPWSNWDTINRVASNTEFFITGGTGNDEPNFVYCVGSRCSGDITPFEADGVRLQSNTVEDYDNPQNIKILYRNGEIILSQLYFKLASKQTQPNRHMAGMQFLPFTTTIESWGPDQNWIGEKSISIPSIGTSMYVPFGQTGCSAQATCRALPLSDPHYNYRTGELLMATQSLDTTASGSALYLFKFRPGLPNYQGYQFNYTQGNSYQNPFPVVLHQGDPGYPPVAPGQKFQALSVTQDMKDNIFVLVATPESSTCQYWVEKFSPQGQYKSRFCIIDRSNANSFENAQALAYNPATPHEILVLALQRTASQTAYLVAYPKDQNQDQFSNVQMSAFSQELIGSTQDPINLSQYNFLDVGGMEYDPLHHRVIFSTSASTAPVDHALALISIDIDLRSLPEGDPENDGSPWQRSNNITQVYPLNRDIRIRVRDALPPYFPIIPNGVAYDPTSNNFYITHLYEENVESEDGFKEYRISRVIPNNNLHRPQ